MGSNESSVRATQFHNEAVKEAPEDDEDTRHHISISNKMVERLVEDAAMAGGAAPAKPPEEKYRRFSDSKDKVLMEKLKMLDDTHTERAGITVEEVNAMATRIAARAASFGDCEPVCERLAGDVIDCYLSQDASRCSETVAAFTKCVQEKTSERLLESTARETRRPRKTRAREVNLLIPHETP